MTGGGGGEKYVRKAHVTDKLSQSEKAASRRTPSEVAARVRARPSRRRWVKWGEGGDLGPGGHIGSVARYWRREEGKEGGTEVEPKPRWKDRSNAWVGLGCAKV